MDEYIDLYSISPTKVVKMVKRRSNFFKEKDFEKKEWEKKEKKEIVKKWHQMEISVNSQRNLRKKIQFLFQFADEKKVVSRNKKIFKYKCAFMTFTLSSKQRHPTAEIVEKIWQPFLDRMRKLHQMTNYVYRLEFQSNGNVHFHLVTDAYVDYYELRDLWNECQDYRNYHAVYVAERANESFADFQSKRGSKKDHKNDIKKYIENKRGLAVANSVDVRVARSNSNIDGYISKYFSKKKGSEKKMNDLDNEENSFGLRLCFWSRSLSKCTSYLMPAEYYPYVHIFNSVKEWSGVVCRWYDYCKVLYISHRGMDWGKRELWSRIWNYFKKKWEYESWSGNECIYIVK